MRAKGGACIGYLVRATDRDCEEKRDDIKIRTALLGKVSQSQAQPAQYRRTSLFNKAHRCR